MCVAEEWDLADGVRQIQFKPLDLEMPSGLMEVTDQDDVARIFGSGDSQPLAIR